MCNRAVSEVAEYTRQVAGMMRLHAYDIRVATSPDTPHKNGSMATTELTWGRHIASVEYYQGFFEADAIDQRNAVTHELLHVHWSPLHAVVLCDLRAFKSVDKSVQKTIGVIFDRQMERCVDAMANVLAPMMPPVPWAEEG